MCIPDAIGGSDIICQAKSGMGKTAVFVISTLQQIEPVEGKVDTLVLCNTRELALQVSYFYAETQDNQTIVLLWNELGHEWASQCCPCDAGII